MKSDINYSSEDLLNLAEQLRVELADARLLDEQGAPLSAVPDPQPAVEFLDANQNRRALLEEAPGNRWLLQFFDQSGGLQSSRSGQLQRA